MRPSSVVRCITAVLLYASVLVQGRTWGSSPFLRAAPLHMRSSATMAAGSGRSIVSLTPRGGSYEALRVDSGDSSSIPRSATALTDASTENVGTALSETMARGGSATVTKKRPETESTDDGTVIEEDWPQPQPSDHTFSGSNNTQFSEVHEFPVLPSGTMETEELNQLDHKRHKSIAKTLKNRNHTNLRRKLLHATSGLLFAALNHVIPRSKFVPGMTVLTTGTLVMELLRYHKGFGWMNDILHFVFGSSLRKHEMDGKFTGSFYFFLGVTVTSAMYSKTAATLGILQLAIADPTASYFGRKTRHVYWSRIGNQLGGFGRNKGILGFLGGAAACVPFNYRLLQLAKYGTSGQVPGGSQALWIASITLGLAGAFADLAVPTPTLTLPKRVCGVRVPPFHVDDNFVVPVFSGYACAKIFDALAWSSDVTLSRWMFI